MLSLSILLIASITHSNNAIQPSEYDYISYDEDFDGKTMDIGYIKLVSCNEGNSNTWSGNDIDQFTFPTNFEDIIQLYLPNAITIKFLDTSLTPDNDASAGDFMVKSDICSNPVLSLNNNQELSWTVDLDTTFKAAASNTDNWIGSTTATDRMSSDVACGNGISVGDSPFPLYDSSESDNLLVFMGWCEQALHVDLNRGNNLNSRCEWAVGQSFGVNIDVYIGFDINGNKCYYDTNNDYSIESEWLIIDQSVNYADAQLECESLGSNLATITNLEQGEAAFEYCQNGDVNNANFGNCWIGLYREDTSSAWLWESGNPSTYSRFAPNEPSNELCAHLYPGASTPGQWGAHGCSNTKPILCDKPKWMVIDGDFTYDEAKEACEEKGYTLGTILNLEEGEQAFELCQTKDLPNNFGNCWIGYRREDTSSPWQWENGYASAYSRFASNEPNNDLCGHLYPGASTPGQWGAHGCANRKPALCDLRSIEEFPKWIVIDGDFTYDEAKAQCTAAGAYSMGTILNLEEAQEAFELCQDKDLPNNFGNCWIGYRRDDTSSPWEWENGYPSVYDRFASNEPNNDLCGHLYPGASTPGQWGGHGCTNRKPVLCDMRSIEQFPKWFVIDGEFTFDQAEAQCQAKGGLGLGTVLNLEEAQEAFELCQSEDLPDNLGNCWIGYYRDSSSDSWQWTSGSSSTYNRFGEFNGGSYTCTIFWPGGPITGQFGGETCTKDRPALCDSGVRSWTASPTMDPTADPTVDPTSDPTTDPISDSNPDTTSTTTSIATLDPINDASTDEPIRNSMPEDEPSENTVDEQGEISEANNLFPASLIFVCVLLFSLYV